MDRTTGRFTTDWGTTDTTCRQCYREGPVQFRCWESDDGRHDEILFRCRACAYTWQIETACA
jgi:hypothetical protein